MIHQDIDLSAQVAPIIKKAGEIVLSYFHGRLTKTEKVTNGIDHGFVTQADLASETYLKQELAPLIPGASIIAEESGKTENTNSDYCWVIDPLDGTTNFAHGLPYFCISVGLTYKNSPVFGMIYQPLTDELFYATQGKGAFLNGKPITVSQASLEKSLLIVGLPYAKDRAYNHLLESTFSIAHHVYAIRNFGAVALDIAYVAAGRAEGTIFQELEWWDVVAGIVLITESGGQVSDFHGDQISQGYKSFIATGNPKVHAELLNLLKIKG